MEDRKQIWTETQQRVIGLARSCSPEVLEARVPACPDWTAKDLVAHMTGVDADFLSGDVDQELSDSWTAKHVDTRKQESIEQVIEEWERVRARTNELFGAVTEEMETGLVADASVHEQDLRGAVGMPGAGDQPGNRMALEMFADGLVSRVQQHQLPSLEVDAGNWKRSFHGREATVQLRVPEFDFYRALTGRRSPDQVMQWAWSDPDAAKVFLDRLSAFGPLRASALVE